MLVLGVHSGYHDACAALYDGYKLVAAVAQERMTRRKVDGGRVPTEAIDECLAIAGAARKDVGAVVLGRGAFPARFYDHLPFDRAIEAERLYGLRLEGLWMHVGTPEAVAAAEAAILASAA